MKLNEYLRVSGDPASATAVTAAALVGAARCVAYPLTAHGHAVKRDGIDPP